MAFGKLTNKVQSVFKEKNSKALAMLGSIEIVNAIIDSKVFEEYDIELIRKDYATVDELMSGIKETKQAKYVFISDSALIGIENGKYDAIKQIREKYSDITIVMFFNDEKNDEKYKNWAFGYKVYHIYYADETGYDFEKIAEELVGKSIPSNNNVSGMNEELEEKERLIKQREAELKEKELQLKELEKQLNEIEKKDDTEENSQQVNFLKAQIKNIQNSKKEAEESIEEIKKQHEVEKEEIKLKYEKENKEYKEKVDKEFKEQIEAIKNTIKHEQPQSLQVKTLGCITIGVFSISPGAGSTYTAINLAEKLGSAGYPTAVVAMDGKKELKYSGGDYAHYIVPEGSDKKVVLLETISSGYNFVIEDFGCLFSISPLGELEINEGTISERKEDIDELLRCSYKIAVGFSNPWHVGKLNFFIENEILDPLTSIYSILGYEGNKDLLKCSLPICERDSNMLIEAMFEWLGIAKKNEKEIKRKRGFFK